MMEFRAGGGGEGRGKRTVLCMWSVWRRREGRGRRGGRGERRGEMRNREWGGGKEEESGKEGRREREGGTEGEREGRIERGEGWK